MLETCLEARQGKEPSNSRSINLLVVPKQDYAFSTRLVQPWQCQAQQFDSRTEMKAWVVDPSDSQWDGICVKQMLPPDACEIDNQNLHWIQPLSR